MPLKFSGIALLRRLNGPGLMKKISSNKPQVKTPAAARMCPGKVKQPAVGHKKNRKAVMGLQSGFCTINVNYLLNS